LAEHQVPVWIPGAPTFRNALGGQIKHLAQRVIIGEAGLIFRDLPELTVQALDNVRRVYDLPNLQRIFKKGAQNFPVFLPAFDTGGILTPPASPKGQEVFLCLVQRHSGANFLQVSHHLLDVLLADVPGGGTNLVDDAALQTALGEHRLDGLRHPA